jgi:formylglycine-generating enzyme required for sulfatase activity
VANIKPLDDGKSILLHLKKKVAMELRHIKGGSFWMGSHQARLAMGPENLTGSENPRHKVRVKDFYLGRFSVTQEEFDVWTTARHIPYANDYETLGDEPADNVSWYQAMDFCVWLTDKVLKNHKDFLISRCTAILPTEAQWEYACRGISDGKISIACDFYNGDGEAAFAQVGLGRKGEYRGFHPVFSHPADMPESHPFGLQQMHGGVGEWCLDIFDDDAYCKRASGTADPCVVISTDLLQMQRMKNGLLTQSEIDKFVKRQLVQAGGKWHRSDNVQAQLGLYPWLVKLWPALRHYHFQEAHPLCFDGRVTRSGGDKRYAWAGRASKRGAAHPNDDNRSYGFRVCLVPDPASAEHQSASQGAGRGAGSQAGAGRLEGGRAQASDSDARPALDLTKAHFHKQ